MRLAVCALSAVLLSGCSWLGGFGSSGHGYSQAQKGKYYAQKGHNSSVRAPQNPYSGGFAQKPNFDAGYGGANYTTGGYGSHAAVAGQQGANYQAGPRLKKPKLRGSFSMGMEKSNAGSYIDYDKVPSLNPETAYNPNDPRFTEEINGSTPTGDGVRTDLTYGGNVYEISKPTISNDDVHSTPFRLAAGLEYIASPHLTLFANAGYTYSEGEAGDVINIRGDVFETTTEQAYVGGVATGPATVNTSTWVNAGTIASFNYNFSDMRRIDGEVGGRYYFDPIVKDQGFKTLTPFVGASAGIASYNAQTVEIGQRQAYYRNNYQDLFNGPLDELSSYEVQNASPRVEVYDSQVVPTGTLTAGMEWQVTEGTALALETGLRFEGAREYSNGAKGDNNIAVPLTLRGSFNF